MSRLEKNINKNTVTEEEGIEDSWIKIKDNIINNKYAEHQESRKIYLGSVKK